MTNEKNEETDSLDFEKKQEISKAMSGDIMADECGVLMGNTLGEMYRIAKMMVISKMIPKSYDSPEKVLTGQQYARSLGLNPFIALRNIAIVNGQPSLYGDLPLGIARKTGKLLHIEEFFIDKDYKEISFENRNLDSVMWGAICVIERSGYPKKSYSFTEIDYARQGGGVSDIWKKYKNIMFMRKARSLALKAQFSDVLEGVVIAEYDFNILPEAGGSYNVNHDGRPSQEEKLNKFEEKLKSNKPDIEVEK